MDSQARISQICRCFLFVVYYSLSLSLLHQPLIKNPITPPHFPTTSLFLSHSHILSFSHKDQNFSSEMDSSGRRPCFIEEDDGLASLADMEAGFSGNYQHPFFSRPMCYSRKGSLRNLSAMGSFGSSSSLSPRSGRFWDARFEEHQPHFLEACFRCKKPLGDNRDIFMYRLDTSNDISLLSSQLVGFYLLEIGSHDSGIF